MPKDWWFLTVFYSGLSPKAPGTAGSFVALPFGMAILAALGSQTLFLATMLITIIAVKSIDAYEQTSQMHDDKRIVIDELAGMWLALSIAPGVTMTFDDMLMLENGFIIQSLIAFGLFRLFDIKKPSYIGRIDRDVQGGLGVMGDDLLAGVAAGIATAVIWQGWLGSSQYF